MGYNFSKLIFSFKTKVLERKLNDLYKESNSNLEVKSLAKLNFKKRQALLKYASEHSEFYRNKYVGIEIVKDGLKTSEDFTKIPPLTREELRANFDSIKIDRLSKRYYEKVNTSGSTSAPVSLLHDRRHPATPIRWRILNWWGVKPWENQAFIYRFKKPFIYRLKNRLLWWPTKRTFLAAANLTPKKLEKFVSDFNRIKPALLQGYVDVVFEFALYLLDNNIKIHPPKMVWVTSAPLFEEQRQLMEKAFGAPVCDQYGNTEILLIAAECPERKGLHIMQDTVHIEFVDKNNQPVLPGTTGKILLTDLTNFAFPLIRYEIGDEGTYKEGRCSCGRPLPLMENVRGRQSYVIKTPTGLCIKGEHIMAMFDGYMKAFKGIQLRQEEDYSVCIDYVPRIRNEGIKEVKKMTRSLRERSRSEVQVTHKEVEKLHRVGRKTPLILSSLK